jgi:SAM-dependent methyltransferase
MNREIGRSGDFPSGSVPDATRFWGAIARRYDRVYARSGDEARRSVARVVAELPRNGRVLDLGVGTGRELPALLDAGHEVVGLDVSPEMLAICAKRARPIPLFEGDLWEPLPWDARSFDAVIALHGTLAHPPREGACSGLAREVARVLRPGGVFVAEVPKAEWLEAVARAGNGPIVWLGGGRARFVDEATRVAIEIVAPTPDEWQAAFRGVLDLQVSDGCEGEHLLVGRVG